MIDCDFEKKQIVVKCEAADALPLDSITPLQGELKKLTNKNRDKLSASIIKYGFTAPIFIYKTKKKNYNLDGHQRIIVLKWLKERGWDIPKIPVAYIEAKSIKKAKERLLQIASQYGKFNKTIVKEWVKELQIDYDDISLRQSALNMDFDIMKTNEIEYKEVHELTIKCKNKIQLEELYNRLTEEGYICQLSIL